MYVLITYDINTTTAAGRKRLRQVAKLCVNHGQRVQNSVFECDLEPWQYVNLQNELMKIIDRETDSLRFYKLNKKHKNNIVHIGAKASYDVDEAFII